MFSPPLNRCMNRLRFPLTLPIERPSYSLQGRAQLMNHCVPSPTINMVIAQPFRRDTKIPKKKSPRRNSKGKDSDPDKPKRPLSAYNLFFQNERVVLLRSLPVRAQGKPKRSHGKIGFVEMAKIIGYKWKCADDSTKAFYDMLAVKERARFDREMEEYNKKKETETQSDRQETETRTPSPVSSSPSSIPSNTSSFHEVFNIEPIGYKPNEESMVLQLDSEMVDILVKSFC